MSDSKPQHDPERLAEHRDRLTDRVLAEAVGKERAPDLSEKILSRVEELNVEASSQTQGTDAKPSLQRILISLSVAAAILVTLTGLLLPDRQFARESARRNSQLNEEMAAKLPNAKSPLVVTLQDSKDLRYQQTQVAERAADFDEEAVLSEEIAVASEPTSEGTEQLQAPLVGDLATVADEAVFSNREAAFPEEKTPSGEELAKPAVQPPSSESIGLSAQLNSSASTESTTDGFRSGLSVNDGAGFVGRGRAKWRNQAEGSTFGAAGQRFTGRPDAVKDKSKRELLGRSEALGDFNGNGIAEEHSRYFYKPEPPSRDQYEPIQENRFIKPVGEQALSTFGVDVDTASYTNVRQHLLNMRRLPPPDAVRVEEFVNYFDYQYESPAAEVEAPFAASMEAFGCPWNEEHRVVRVGLKGREVEAEKRPLSNLVFLVDVSGSMNDPDKLPLVIEGLSALTDRLGENDRVAIVVYAGSEGVVLPSTNGERKDEIRSALGRLQAGGSTAGGAGLKLACSIAEQNKIPGGTNRVILCTDGDFNVGLSGTDELTKLVESNARDKGIYMTVLGFGRGNLNDAMLESISGHGDGHYAYIDNAREARRVLSEDLSGTLVTIAKDVKIQVEFNPTKVAAYRLIGYENRVMAAKDFNDDRKDAGDIGAGHRVTALYEVVPAGVEAPSPSVDGLKYQQAGEGGQSTEGGDPEASAPGLSIESEELLTLKVRYKQPEGGSSKKLEFPLIDSSKSLDQASADSRWAAAAAQFGMLLRNSRYVGESNYQSVLDLARPAIGEDPLGYRAEMLDMVRRAAGLARE